MGFKHAFRPESRARSFMRRNFADNSGVAAIEFAIVAPILFLLLIGMLVYGLYFGTVHAVQQLAADSARASIPGLTDSERTQLATDHARLSAGNYALLDQSRLTVNASADTQDSSGAIFVVTVTYDASNLPIYGFGGLVAAPSSIITRSASIRRGSY